MDSSASRCSGSFVGKQMTKRTPRSSKPPEQLVADVAGVVTHISDFCDCTLRPIDRGRQHLGTTIGRVHITGTELQTEPVAGLAEHHAERVKAAQLVVAVVFGARMTAVDLVREGVDVQRHRRQLLAIVHGVGPACC